MADDIVRYRSDRGQPGFRAPSTAGAAARANDLAEQANVLGQAASVYEKSAGIYEDFSNAAYKIGADMAEHRGKTKPTQVRDKDGMLAPINESWTLSIEGRVYQDRQAQAWANQAYLDFQQESNRAYQEYKNEPQQFRDHMASWTDDLLEKAPASKRDQIEIQLRNHMESQAFGLEGVNMRAAERAGDVATQNIIVNQRSDLKALIARGERPGVMQEGGYAINPIVAEKVADITERLNGLSDPYMARTLRDALAQDLTFDMLDGYYVGEAHRVYANPNLSPEQVDLEMERLANEVFSGEQEIPVITGFAEDGKPIMGSTTFDQLGQDQQDQIRQDIEQRRGVFMELRKAERMRDINSFIYDSATQAMSKIDQISFNVPNEWRQTIEDVATLNGVPPYLVAAIMKQENGNLDPLIDNPQTNSRGEPNGGRGLMQIVQSTFDEFKTAAGVPNGNMHDPLDSIRVGVTYMGHIRNRIIEDDKWGIANDQAVMNSLIAYGYKAGHGALRQMMTTPGFDPYDESTWVDVGKVSKYDQNALAYVWDVQEKAVAMGGGAEAMMRVWQDKAKRRFANDPVAYMDAVSKMQGIARQAQSASEYNQSLTWRPIGLTEGAVNRWVGASWMRMGEGMDDLNNFQANWSSVMTHLDPNNPMAQAVNNGMMQQYQRALGSGNTSNMMSLMQEMTQPPGATPSMSKLIQGDKLIGDIGQAPDVLDYFETGVNQALASGMEPEKVANNTAAMLVNAFSFGGKAKNGMVPFAAVRFYGQVLERAAAGNLDPTTLTAASRALRGLVGVSPRARDAPVLGRGQRQPSTARATLETLAKYVGAPVGLNMDAPNNAAVSASKRALLFLERNGDLLANPADPNNQKARGMLNDLLHGKAPEGSWARENDPEKQKAISDAVVEYMDDGMWVSNVRYLVPQLAGKYGQMDWQGIQGIMKDKMAYLSQFYGGELADDWDVLAQNAVETGIIDGSLGMSYLTLPTDQVTQSKDYSPMYGTFVSFPVEANMPQTAIVTQNLYDSIKPDLTLNYGDEDLPVRRGTVQGWMADALADKYPHDQAIELYKKGHLKLQYWGMDFSDPDYPAPVYGIFSARDNPAQRPGVELNPIWQMEAIKSSRDMVKLATDRRWQSIVGMADATEWAKTTDPGKAMSNFAGQIRLRADTTDKPVGVEGVGKVYPGDKDWFPDFATEQLGLGMPQPNLPGGEEFGGGPAESLPNLGKYGRYGTYGMWRNRMFMPSSALPWYSVGGWIKAPFESMINTRKQQLRNDAEDARLRKRDERLLQP